MPEDDAPRSGGLVIKPLPIILGFVAGLGVAVLLQQYAVTPLTLGLLLGLGVLGAAVFGLLPTVLIKVMAKKEETPEKPPEVHE